MALCCITFKKSEMTLQRTSGSWRNIRKHKARRNQAPIRYRSSCCLHHLYLRLDQISSPLGAAVAKRPISAVAAAGLQETVVVET